MLTLLPTPIGNLKDITLRALQALQNSEVVIAEDTRVSKRLIYLLEEKELLEPKEREFLSFHSHSSEEFFSKLSKEFFDKNIIYMTDAGMPCISDPGSELVNYCQKNGIEYDVFPGANALLTAFSASGFGDREFLFAGFLSSKQKERQNELSKLLNSGFTAIIYESPARIEALLKDIATLESDREVFLAKELTKLHQTYISGNAQELYEKIKSINQSGEWVVVIKKREQKSDSISLQEILNMELPPKIKAKLAAKISGENSKDIYKNIASLPR